MSENDKELGVDPAATSGADSVLMDGSLGNPGTPAEHVAPRDCVVVVDDESIVRRLMQRGLPKAAPDLTILSTAENGAEGLVEIDKILSDLHSRLVCVVSDQMMPVMNGVELYEALRGRDGGKDVPFLMMSGWMPEDLQAKVEAIKKVDPLFRFIDKPFVLADVANTIQELIRIRAIFAAAREVD